MSSWECYHAITKREVLYHHQRQIAGVTTHVYFSVRCVERCILHHDKPSFTIGRLQALLSSMLFDVLYNMLYDDVLSTVRTYAILERTVFFVVQTIRMSTTPTKKISTEQLSKSKIIRDFETEQISS